MTHTPGPWKIDEMLSVSDPVICGENRPVAKAWYYGLAGPSGQFRDRSIDANAALIAAAPELLEACHKALDGMYNQHPQYETMSCEALRHPDMDCYAVEVILDIRAAIAKAEEQ